MANRALADLEAAERAFAARFGLKLSARRFQGERSGLGLRALEAGEGEPLVFVHGGGSIAAGWTPLLAELGGRRCIAVDRPGCGGSDPFDYAGVELRNHAVGFLEDVLDELGLGRADIVANSMGGLWSAWLGLDRPGRVRSLALLGAPALVLGTSAPLPVRLLGVRGLNRVITSLSPSPARTRRFLNLALGTPAVDRMAPELIDASHAGELMPGAAIAWRTLLERAVRLRGARLPLGEAELGKLETPVLLVWGSRDSCAGLDVARRTERALPGARLEIMDAGHAPWLDDPGACGRLVRAFLGEVAQASAASSSAAARRAALIRPGVVAWP
jgi:pimeloyl-ACP methyl ester carboxylesterase